MIAFWWSGFVRAGIGFGGAGLMYPIALLVVDSVLFLVPIICFQLLFFTTATLVKEHTQIDWRVLGWLLLICLPTFLVGVFGLINLPDSTILLIVYVVLIAYALGYILDFRLEHSKKWIEIPALMLGGYVGGMSLAGAPIIAAVAIGHLQKHNVRATLFVLWILLVILKVATLYSFDVDLQFRQQLWAFPCALVGHVMGLRLHQRLLTLQNQNFYRWMGIALLVLSLVGVARHFF